MAKRLIREITFKVDEKLFELLRRDAERRRLTVSAMARAILAEHYAKELNSEAGEGGGGHEV